MATVTNSMFEHNEARAGSGNTGGGTGIYVGSALGGAIDTTGENPVGPTILLASNLTVRHNWAVGGDGGPDGLGVGGGVYNLGTFLFDATTVIAHNRASTSHDDCFGC